MPYYLHKWSYIRHFYSARQLNMIHILHLSLFIIFLPYPWTLLSALTAKNANYTNFPCLNVIKHAPPIIYLPSYAINDSCLLSNSNLIICGLSMFGNALDMIDLNWMSFVLELGFLSFKTEVKWRESDGNMLVFQIIEYCHRGTHK